MGQQVLQNGKRQRLVRQSDVNVFNQILVQLDQLDADHRLEDSGDVPRPVGRSAQVQQKFQTVGTEKQVADASLLDQRGRNLPAGLSDLPGD